MSIRAGGAGGSPISHSGLLPAGLSGLGTRRVALGVYALALSVLVLALPVVPFSIDNMLYIEMARAMAERGSFSIAGAQDLIPEAWTSISLTYGMEGGVYPQYPGGYALLSAPFYALMGVRGLAMMNIIAACIILFLTHRIAMRVSGDRVVAMAAAGVMAVGSFLPVYAVGVWPHLVTLAMVMAGVERALAASAAASEARQGRAYLDLALAGLCFGLALNLRVDVLFPAAAVVVWLRLFAFPSQRLAAVAFVAGIVPGLVLASLVNLFKFGELSPFSYGPTDGTDSLSGYPVLMLAAGVGAVALFVVDSSAWWVRRGVAMLQTPRGALAVFVVGLVGVAVIGPARQFAFNMYVLVIDLQWLEPAKWQSGVSRGADGFIQFWGAYKKAFLQSLPWAGLMVAAVWAFLRGERAKEYGLLLGVMAAPIVFYSLNQWHGGYSFSMRYFLPALPMVAILSAFGLRDVLGDEALRWRVFLIAGGVVLLAGVPLLMRGVGDPGYNPPGLQYYPAMGVLALLAAGSVWLIVRPGDERVRIGQAGLAGCAVAVAVLVNLFDVSSFSHRKTFVEMLNTRLAQAVGTDALVLSVFDEAFFAARRQGVATMNPKTQDVEVVRDAISVYRLGDRCVYAYMDDVFASIPGASQRDWRVSQAPGVAGELGVLYQPVDQSAACDPERRAG